MKLVKFTLFFIPSLLGGTSHNCENDCMLLGIPSSGSTFLAQVIADSNENLKYVNERLTIQWGGLSYCKYGLDQEVKGLYSSRFLNTDLNFTKEVFLSLYLGILRERFDIVVLYRHRKHTFPLKDREQYFLHMFREFTSPANQCSRKLKPIIEYVRSKARNDLVRCVAMHTIFNYILMADASYYNIKILEYNKIMTFGEEELNNYLQSHLPEKLMSPGLSSQIFKRRFNGDSFLKMREEKYEDLGIESFVQKLISFMKKIDPEMPYWYLFD